MNSITHLLTGIKPNKNAEAPSESKYSSCASNKAVIPVNYMDSGANILA